MMINYDETLGIEKDYFYREWKQPKFGEITVSYLTNDDLIQHEAV